MSDSILLTLREEHREVDHLIERILSCQDVVEKKELYLNLKDLLIPHMEGEEKTIYAHLIEDVDDEEAEELASFSIQEHQAVKDMFSRLDNIGIESDEWCATFREMQSAVQHHVEEEEMMLFSEAKADFSRDELAEFDDEFQDVKSHIHPNL